MPGQNGGWLHHRQACPPAIPEAREEHPEDTVNRPKCRQGPSVNEARELVGQCNILGDEISAILENGGHNGENQWKLERHPANYGLSPNWLKKSENSLSYRIMTRDKNL